MLNYQEFYSELLERLNEKYPSAVFHEQEILKVNQKWNAIIMEEEGCNYPTVYPENLYENYKEVEDMDIIMKFVDHATKPEPYIKSCIDKLRSWDGIKEALFPYVANMEKNKDYFSEGKVYRPYLDLAIGLYVDLGPDGEGGNATVFVTEKVLEYWGVIMEEAYEVAFANVKYRVQTLQEVLEELMGIPLTEEGEKLVASKHTWMLSTPERRYGAVGIVNEELLRKTAEQLDTDLYILPCSIHELLLVPEAMAPSKEDLCEMVKSINENEVEDEVFLSNNVYLYSREQHQVKIVEVD